ncbi:MAG: response regulator [Hymenobacter sp.]|nr:MAG: response regulator [Hymenobacter sp.]
MNASFLILLVDDDPFIVDILNRAARIEFPEANFVHVPSFQLAAQYLDGLRGRGPRLVLLDIDLHAEHTGLDFLVLMRQHPKGRLVPVVMLSTNNQPVNVSQAYDLGASVFTTKPFDYDDWKQYVRYLRSYWFETVQTPVLWFTEADSE